VQQGRWDEARQAYEEAASLARAIPYPYAEAVAHYEYGMLHWQRGELEQAVEQLEEALITFRHLGARPLIERTERILRDCTQ
jgi:tetratricopeptide (TPR) repeat protein